MNSSTGKRIFRLGFPLILQQLCLQMQIWIDRAMLGHVNAEFFSAIGNTTVPYHMVTSIIIAICGGTTILVAQNTDAGRLQQVADTAESSFFIRKEQEEYKCQYGQQAVAVLYSRI